MGRHTTTSAQTYEGSSEEVEEQESDSQLQVQEHSVSLKTVMRHLTDRLMQEQVVKIHLLTYGSQMETGHSLSS